MSEACAEIVARDDPHLHATALFAARSDRARLLVLYAFDCELSRATRVSKESMIPRMRLQWWRDVVRDAAAGGEPKAHEVAGPLAQLIQTDPALISDITEIEGRDTLSRMVEGYERELEVPFSGEDFANWSRARFGARLGLAGSIAPMNVDYGHAEDNSIACRVLALGLACRTAARMAATQGQTLLPDGTGAEAAELARGSMPEETTTRIRLLAREALKELRALRKARRLKGQALVAHLPVLREVRVLARVARNPAAILGQIDDVERPFAGLRLAINAWRNRWC